MSKNIEKREIIMFKKTLKRAMSLLLVAVIVFSAIPSLSIATTAAFNRSTDIIYSQTSSVTVGKIRYVAQQNSSGADFSDYFYPGYWYNGNAKQGCFVASTSMALSYMGVNMTPKVMYEKGLISNYTSSWNNLATSTTVASKASSVSGISVSSIYTGTVVTSFSTLDTAINNFQNGNGMYSPPIVWTKGSNGGTHYFLVTKKISSNLYEMVDPISEDNKQVNLVSYATNIVYGNGGTAKGQLSDVIQYKRNTAIPSTSYTITYNANGGSGAPSSQSHSSGATHTVKSTIPARFGYTFVGWGTSSSATSGYLPGQTFTVTGNRTLYAIWQSAYSCPANLGNGTYSASIIGARHCKYYTITPSSTRKYHIESTGSIDSKITIYNSSGTELISDDDAGNDFNFSLDYTFQRGQKYYIKIHAYNDNKGTIPFTMRAYYNITYNANGGSGAPSSQEKLYGQNIYLSSTIPQRSGYTFLGWATSANATSAQYSAGATYSAESNATLYAVWKQNSVATVPATPKVTGVNTLKGIDIKWNSIPGAVKYVVYKRLGTSSTWDIVATTTGTSYSDTNAPSAGSYYIYSVKAYNSANTPSNYEKAKTAVIQRVIAPYTKAANATNGINVTWGKVAGANKYVVLRRIGTESTWRIIGETTGTSFLDTNVNVGIYYLYSIRAINGTGYSAYDINKRFTIQYITAPTARAYNKSSGVQVSWNSVTGAKKYNVYRRLGGTSTWVYVGTTK